ncbi:hypothetical protein BDV39DRAFT_198562 [Aspergillus sergii]|uniref:EF-hand domain-containing protein n=1 Tax=Aspergillus sergii TaxID=1034303 RepID=A0A5N6XLC9_9EURO|nr:hypothetical protein BDV39DRAFT_198562 [Aspergillus sergii]
MLSLSGEVRALVTHNSVAFGPSLVILLWNRRSKEGLRFPLVVLENDILSVYPTYGGVQYTREETRKWKELFTKINTGSNNHKNLDDNIIDVKEYIAFARSEGLALNDDEAEEWFKEMDKNHDGEVSFKEFINAFGEKFENKHEPKKE